MMPEKVIQMLKEKTRNSFRNGPIACVTDTFEKRTQMLPAKDEVRLYTVITRPTGLMQTSFPVVVQRSCYPDQEPIYEAYGEELAKRGFVHVMQFCRGIGKSEGEWEPNVNEREDGLSLLGWLNAQTWVESMVWWGTSYLALTGWVLADVVPSKMKGMVLNVYGTDRFFSAYEKGMFRHDVLTGWAMENAGHPVQADYLESCRFRPQMEVDETLWGGRLPWYRDWISNTERTDAYWQSGFWKMLQEIPGHVKVPVHIIDAWYDHHFGSAIHTWEGLNPEVKEHSHLTIGCWNHFCESVLPWMEPKHLENDEICQMLAFTKEILLDGRLPKQNIRYYQVGADCWKQAHTFPPRAENIVRFYLTGRRELTVCAGEEEQELSFLYDPQNPVPSCGGEALLTTMSCAGSRRLPEPGWREDVITFISPVLDEPLNIFGKINVKLAVRTDADDTSFTARVSQVFPDGSAYHIRSSITRVLADNSTYRPGERANVCVTMWDISWQIPSGCRLRLDISSSDFPQYAIHTNYAGLWAKQRNARTARQTIFCGEDSVLEIPAE